MMYRLKLSTRLLRNPLCKIGLALVFLFALKFDTFSQHPVLDPNDPIVEYDADNPPTSPDWGTMVKWVRTKRLGWDSDAFKAYFYKGMAFRVMWPKDYDPSGNTKYPMVIMLHGRGERQVIYDNEFSMKHGGQRHRDAVNNGQWPGFVVYPQNTSGYFAESHFNILNDLINNHFPDIHVDVNRVSVHGLSAGGQATWNTVIDHPKDYASAIPMSAAGLGYLDGLESLRYVPIWLSQGGRDSAPHPNTSKQVTESLWSDGVNIRYTLYPNLGHGVWNTHYREADFFPFMIRAHKANPVVASGEAALVYSSSSKLETDFIVKSEFCPGESINVPMGLTAGFEGYEWRKDGVLIEGANSNTFTALELGTYDARIKRAGEWSVWSPTPIEVKMKEATQTPDIAVVGLASKVIPAPDGSTSVELELPNGFIEYAWFQEGSSSPIGTSRTVEISTPGNYVASVQEQFGCSSNVSAPFTVVNANGSNGPDEINGFVGTAISKTELRLNWSDNPNPVNNETGFEIYRAEEAGGTYELVSITPADQLSFIDEERIPNTTYYYVIRAVNENGASAVSSEISVTTLVDDVPPAAPLNVRVSGKTKSTITLSWDEASDDVGIFKYEIYRGANKAAVVDETSGTVFNLVDGEVYTFTVRARDFAGNLSPASSQVVATPGFSGLNYKYYEARWSVLPDFNSLTPVKEGTSANVDISVRDVNDDFGFLWEGFINIETPGTYTFETRSDDGSKLYIGGYDEDYLVVNNDGLHGMRYRSGNYTFTEAGAYPIAMTFFERGGGQGMEVYWSSNELGFGRTRIPDNVFIDETPIPDIVPNAPTDLAGIATSFNSISLNWTDQSDDETGFQLYRSESLAGNYVPVAIVDANTTSYLDTNLQPSTEYFYQIIALGAYGESEGLAGPPVSILPMNFGIAARDNATGTGYLMYSEESVHTRFSSNRPHGSNADHVIAVINNNGQWQYDNNSSYYNFSPVDSDLLLAEVNFSTDEVVSLEGSSGSINSMAFGFFSGDLSFIANKWGTNNSNNGEFYIEGTSFNRNVNSSVAITTLALPSPPESPSEFSVTAESSTQLQLSWTDESTNETGFEIYRSVSNDQNFLLLDVLDAESTSFSDADLFSNTTYFYEVFAVNEGGSTASGQQSASTLNNVPELSPTGDLVMRYETLLEIPLFASDEDPEALTLSITNLPAFGSFVDFGDGSGLLTFNPAIEDAGTFENITITVSDENGGVADESISLTVDGNNQPTLASVENVILGEGDSYQITLSANDPDGNEALTWSHDLPAFVQFEEAIDGEARLIISPSYADGGLYEETIEVLDPDGGSASTTFTIEVTEVDPNQTILVNFVNNTLAASPWNNVSGTSTLDLSDQNGASTGVDIVFPSAPWNSFRDGAVTGDNSGVYPDDVIKDYYYFGIFGAPETVDMRVSGLDPERDYTFTFFGSSKWGNVPDNGSTEYTIGEETVSVYVQNNAQTTASISQVRPNAFGDVIITMSKAAGAPVGYINALDIRYVFGDGSAPAEPRTLSASFSGSAVQLDWIDAPYNEEGFEIQRAENGGPFSAIGTVGADSETFVDENVSESINYTYRVLAFNSYGTSGYSNVVEVSIPNTPPSIDVVSSVEVSVGATESISITASDPSSATLTLGVVNLPSFATFQDNGDGTGEISFSPTSSDLGSYSLDVTATDDQNATSLTNVSVTVIENQLYTVAVNFSGNLSSAGWNNTSKVPAANDVFSNLLDDTGSNTGLSLTLNTRFGGVYAQGATTGDDSGVVPDNVLREYYWFGTFGAPEVIQMTVGGLDQLAKYTFKFVGSSVFSGAGITDNGETIYEIGGSSVSVDVQDNTGEMGLIQEVSPNGNGEIVITLRKGTGATIGYINAMIIEAFESDLDQVDQTPGSFAAFGSSKTTIDLNWEDNAYEELGYEVYRQNGVEYALIATTSADVTSYIDAGLNPGDSYSYKVRAILPDNAYTEFSNASSAATMAFAININLNGDPIYNAPEPWNNIGFLPDDGISVTGFKNEFGNETGIVLDFVQSMSGSNDWGTNTGNDSGVYPDAVLESFYFMESGDEATITVEGLDQSYVYNFNFLGAIETNFNVFTDFSIGDEKVTNDQTWNTTTYSTIRGVVPDVNNSVTLKVVSTPGSRWSIWNSLVIEAYPNLGGSAQNARTANDETFTAPSDALLATWGNLPSEIKGLGIYPNPVVDAINIHATVDKGSIPVHVALYNLNGVKIVEQNQVWLGSNVHTVPLGDRNLESGVYILKLTGKGITQTLKILKQ